MLSGIGDVDGGSYYRLYSKMSSLQQNGMQNYSKCVILIIAKLRNYVISLKGLYHYKFLLKALKHDSVSRR